MKACSLRLKNCYFSFQICLEVGRNPSLGLDLRVVVLLLAVNEKRGPIESVDRGAIVDLDPNSEVDRLFRTDETDLLQDDENLVTLEVKVALLV